MGVQDEKREMIERILENPVYMNNSGMIENLRKSLMKLSLSDLSNLRIVCDMKQQPTYWKATERGTVPTSPSWVTAGERGTGLNWR